MKNYNISQEVHARLIIYHRWEILNCALFIRKTNSAQFNMNKNVKVKLKV